MRFALGLKASLALQGALGLTQEDYPAGCLGLGAFVIALSVGTLGRRFGMPKAMDPMVSSLLVAHVVLGVGLGAYEAIPWYDKLLHFVGTGAMAVLALDFYRRWSKHSATQLPSIMIALGLPIICLGLGAAWEIFEFLIDQTGWYLAQQGLCDTMCDLAFDLAGGVAVAVANMAGWLK